jgi:hypothetical protein
LAAKDDYIPLKYQGTLKYVNDALYFAGYTEPQLIKLSQSGKVLFHRRTLDNFDTSINYYKGTEGSFLAHRLSTYALLSTWWFDVDDRYIYAIQDHNKEEAEYQYIDLYSKDTGDYEYSVRIKYLAQQIMIKNGIMIVTAVYKDSDEVNVFAYDIP